MGQNNSMELPQSSSQRIRPTPGSQGRRNRKGTISVYCENSHSIYTFMSKPGMTIGDLKNLLPNKNCDLKILDSPLDNSVTIESIGIDNKMLLRMVIEDKHIHKSNSSTADSLPEPETPKIIGPKKNFQEKPQKPNHESICSLSDEAPLPLNLKFYAVPDLTLKKSYAISYKKPLYQ